MFCLGLGQMHVRTVTSITQTKHLVPRDLPVNWQRLYSQLAVRQGLLPQVQPG